MLKKVSVHQLQLGMHLKEFCGSWMDHPFWPTGFVLKDPKDIELILGSKIKEVWIDCALGSDVAVAVPPEVKPVVEPVRMCEPHP